jgi:hypothetical protein
MKRFVVFVFWFLGSSAMAQQIEWPPLPKDGFLIGRTAVQADVTAGQAVFATEKAMFKIQMSEILIPQYAWHVSGESKTPMIVLQAEETNGHKIIGARDFSGEVLVGFAEEFVFIGRTPPR